MIKFNLSVSVKMLNVVYLFVYFFIFMMINDNSFAETYVKQKLRSMKAERTENTL